MHTPKAFQKFTRDLIEHRLLISLGLSACGVVLQSLYPIHESNSVLRMIALERPNTYLGLVWSYTLFSLAPCFWSAPSCSR